MKAKLPSLALILTICAVPISSRSQIENPTLQEYLAEKAAEHNQMLLDLERQFEGDNMERLLNSMAADRDAAFRTRLETFIDHVFEFAEQIEELVPLYQVPLSTDTRETIERLSGELEDSIGRMRDFVNYGTDAPQINVAPLPEESASVRIFRLVDLSRRLIPNIISLAGATTIELDLLNQVRDDLAIAEALSLALPRSMS